MKKIDTLISKAFLGPFIVTFFIAMFALIMQFLWKYIDDLVGKGLELTVIAELIFYLSATIVPLALPIAILLSSIMTLGNLGERYELVALKSSGISLFRFLRSLMVLALLLSIGSFVFSNYVLPVANLKFYTLLYSVTRKKPALNIKPGVYYNGINGFVIRIGDKAEDNKTVYDIQIYDHTANKGNINVLLAEKGEMTTSDNERFLLFNLFNGVRYEESAKSKRGSKKDQKDELLRMNFNAYEMVFDLSNLDFEKTNEDVFRNNQRMLNIKQLNNGIDSLINKGIDRSTSVTANMKPYFTFLRDKSMDFYDHSQFEKKEPSTSNNEDKTKTTTQTKKSTKDNNNRTNKTNIDSLKSEVQKQPGNASEKLDSIKKTKEKRNVVTKNIKSSLDADNQASKANIDITNKANTKPTTSRNRTQPKELNPPTTPTPQSRSEIQRRGDSIRAALRNRNKNFDVERKKPTRNSNVSTNTGPKTLNKNSKKSLSLDSKATTTTKNNTPTPAPPKPKQQKLYKPDSLAIPFEEASNFLAAQNLVQSQAITVSQKAANLAKNVKNFSRITQRQFNTEKKRITRYAIEIHAKFIYALACFVLFLIGASLGALIRKGGLGMPMVVAIVFFVIFHLLSTIGKKTAEEMVLTPFMGMWLPIFILFPLGIFLLYKANNDSQLLNANTYKRIAKAAAKLLKGVVGK